MALTKKQQRALENIVNALINAEASPNWLYWMGIAKKEAIDLIPEDQRVLDPQPYKHKAYPDRSAVDLSGLLVQAPPPV